MVHSTRTSVPCVVRKVAGFFSVVEGRNAGVKAEVAASATAAVAGPDFVAIWTTTADGSAGGDAAAAASLAFRLDLRCDVVDLLVTSKPPATSAKVVVSKERCGQGHLGPCAGDSFVATFPSTEDRQRFVDAVKYWRLGADEAAALRALAAAAASADGASELASPTGNGGTSAIDSKRFFEQQATAVKTEDTARGGDDRADTSGVAIVSAAERARERAWVRHDATLRQLFDALVTTGVISEDEFAVAHQEERAAFFTEAPASNQRLGLDSLSDALSDLVDPVTHQLRPITEQTAANVFAQSPALASVYRQRVHTSEDELVFWDAVVRRVLFLSRTLLDRDDDPAPAAAAPAAALPAALRGGAGNDALSASWNERSEAALRLLEDSDVSVGVSQASGKRMARPPGSDATDDARRRREGGRHRREAGDAEAAGGLEELPARGSAAAGSGAGALLAHGHMSDLEVPPSAVAAGVGGASEAASVDGGHADEEAWWNWRLEESFGCGTGPPNAAETEKAAAVSTALLDRIAQHAARRQQQQWDPDAGPWDCMIAVSEFIDLPLPSPDAKRRSTEHQRQAAAAGGRQVPLQLRTCHSLHRLFFRQLLACQAQARALGGVAPAAREAAARTRCGEVLAAFQRARDKAFADPPSEAAEADPSGAWAQSTRKVDALLGAAVKAHASAAAQWGGAW